jgi:sterol desaturase/sphingolipid hydroxylase (fatty acid hydroxylase superfamily)
MPVMPRQGIRISTLINHLFPGSRLAYPFMPSEYEITLRLSFFFGIFMLMAGWEAYAPRRHLTVSKILRWRNNLALTLLNSLILRLVFPITGTGMAIYAQINGWGLFNWAQVPAWLALIVSVILLDLVIYWQHVMMHALPLLWRIHRAHHADLDIDVTTGARFHPLEMLLSMLIKFAAIMILGAPVLAVLIFEIVLNAMAMFNHSNIRLPLMLDRILRQLIVTPDMHRVHHSAIRQETNSNYGFNLAIWDKLFATYRDQPKIGHSHMTIGLSEWRDTALCCRLINILIIPFRK